MILGILQARMGSTRLPGKMLEPIQGRPLLEHVVRRVQRARSISRLVVATTVDAGDDAIASLCADLGADCFRGSRDDVLDRFYHAARARQPEHVVRISGDCPLMDPALIDRMTAYYLEGGYEFAANTIEPSFPDGLDLWVFRFSALKRAYREAWLPSHREHVTQYFIDNPHLFRTGSYKEAPDLSHLRWTVDEPADLEVIRAIYDALYPADPEFGTGDVLRLLEERPELARHNERFMRDAGLERSRQADARRAADREHAQSRRMFDRARQRIPGVTQLLSKRPGQFCPGIWPGYYAKAKGAEVWDLDGHRYVDMSIAGIGANVLGYADDGVDEAVRGAIASGSSSSLNCPEEVALAEALCELHPWASMVRFARSGGESMAVAVRIARAATGRDTVAFCGYHGWHDWYLAANLDGDRLAPHLLPGLEPLGVPRGLEGTVVPFAYNELEELRAIVTAQGENLAAIVLEPLRGIEPAPGFLEGVRELACATGAVLVFDEVSSGFRYARGGAHLRYGVDPDVAVFAKALGNGYPIGAIIGEGRVMDIAQDTFISSTSWTERTGPAAALAVLERFRREDVPGRLWEIGERVQAGWRELGVRHGAGLTVGGLPPVSHFTFENPEPQACKAYVVWKMRDRGFLASNAFYAMYAHEDDHVRRYLDALDGVLAELKPLAEAGEVAAALPDGSATAGFRRVP